MAADQSTIGILWAGGGRKWAIGSSASVRPRGQETYPSGLNRNNRGMNTLAIVNPRCLLIRVPLIRG